MLVDECVMEENTDLELEDNLLRVFVSKILHSTVASTIMMDRKSKDTSCSSLFTQVKRPSVCKSL